MKRDRLEFRRAARAAGMTVEEWTDEVLAIAASRESCAACCRPLRRRDHYMVTDAIWSMFGAGCGLLHLRCLERWMGRRVRVDDLKICGTTLQHRRCRGMIERELTRWPLSPAAERVDRRP